MYNCMNWLMAAFKQRLNDPRHNHNNMRKYTKRKPLSYAIQLSYNIADDVTRQ